MWSSKERKEAVLICQQWLEGDIINNDLNKILYYIEELYLVTDALLPYNDKIANAIESIKFATEDILEMDSLSSGEKEQRIRNMIEEDKDELQSLAKQAIENLEEEFERTKIDLKEQIKEMEEKGYEQDTIDRFVKNILGDEELGE